MWKCYILIVFTCSIVFSEIIAKPNVVVFMADDLGWNDVSFLGSDHIFTPNIDALAYDGVILHRYYSYSICTPTRSSFLTGNYAHVVGMQGYPLVNGEDRSIPHNYKLLSSYMKDEGYAAHLVGKWHVGCANKSDLPTERGFDTHFGYRNGYTDYYEYFFEKYRDSGNLFGLDLFRNLEPAWDQEGYLTRVLTDEAIKIIEHHNKTSPLFLFMAHAATHSQQISATLQAPPESVRANRHIASLGRRTYAGMATELDNSIAAVVEKLHQQKLLENTIIIFMSDNGGAPADYGIINWGSNLPLRGQKFTPFEGGHRVPSFVWAPNLRKGIWNGLMHVSDWLPTILTAIGSTALPKNIDGKSQWQNLKAGGIGRDEIVVDIDDYSGFVAIISGDFKLIKGNMSGLEIAHLGINDTVLVKEPPNYKDLLERSYIYGVLKGMRNDSYLKESLETRRLAKIKCDTQDVSSLCVPDKEKVCLFNIIEDPCELHDVSSEHPDIVAKLLKRTSEEWERRRPRKKTVTTNPAANPKNFNYTWDYWLRD